MGDVKTAADQSGNLHVASDADGFRGGGHAAQAEANRLAAFAHDGASEERRVLAMVDDGQVERLAIFERLPEQLGCGDGMTVVADSDDSRFLHRLNFGEALAFAGRRNRANRPHADGS